MIYKEKLAGEGGEIKDYTHVLETAYDLIQRDDYYHYTLSPPAGSLTPQTIDNSNTIFAVGYDSGNGAVFVDVVGLKVDAVYFGAKSKNSVVRLPFWGSRPQYNIYQDTSYTAANIDMVHVVVDANTTPQEVWISTAPPPLVRRESLRANRLARIATFTERWHNEQKSFITI